MRKNIRFQLQTATRQILEAPKNGSLYVLRAKLEAREGKLTAAIRDLSLALEFKPNDAAVLVERGWMHLRRGMPRAALDDFDRALLISGKKPRAHLGRGLALVEIGQLEEAICSLDTAIQLRPEAPRYWHERACVYSSEIRAYDKALRDIAQAIMLDDSRSEYHGLKGYIELVSGAELEVALSDLDRACNITPESTWNRYYRGLVQFCLRNWVDAGLDFSFVAAHEPATDALVSCLFLYLCHGFLDSADSARMELRTRYLELYTSCVLGKAESRIEHWPEVIVSYILGSVDSRAVRGLLQAAYPAECDVIWPYALMFIALNDLALGNLAEGRSALSSIVPSDSDVLVSTVIRRVQTQYGQ